MNKSIINEWIKSVDLQWSNEAVDQWSSMNEWIDWSINKLVDHHWMNNLVNHGWMNEHQQIGDLRGKLSLCLLNR